MYVSACVRGLRSLCAPFWSSSALSSCMCRCLEQPSPVHSPHACAHGKVVMVGGRSAGWGTHLQLEPLERLCACHIERHRRRPPRPRAQGMAARRGLRPGHHGRHGALGRRLQRRQQLHIHGPSIPRLQPVPTDRQTDRQTDSMSTSACMCVCMYARVSFCVSRSVCAYACVSFYVRVYVCMYVYVRMYVYMCVCMCALLRGSASHSVCLSLGWGCVSAYRALRHVRQGAGTVVSGLPSRGRTRRTAGPPPYLAHIHTRTKA
jgi:hypothetical protein